MSLRSHLAAGIIGAVIGYPVTSLLEYGAGRVIGLYQAPAALVWQADDRGASPGRPG